MSVTTTIAALQAVNGAIAGIRSAPAVIPPNLDTARLPIALVWPDEATWRPQAIDLLMRAERTYTVRVYVDPVAQDRTGATNGYATCVTMLELFGRAYLADISLGGTVDHITALTDSGVSGGSFDLMWGGVAYWGFVFKVTVVEKTAA